MLTRQTTKTAMTTPGTTMTDANATHDAVTIGLVSISDRASAGIYEDKGIPALQDWLGRALKNPITWVTRLIPDEQDGISATLRDLVDVQHCRLVLTTADGMRHPGVVPVRAFPIAAPNEGLSLVDGDGREVAWVEALDKLPPPLRALIAEELLSREFTPVIRRIVSVSTFSTPSIWQVDTDRGVTSFVLKGEEDIRRLNDGALWIADSHGIQFIVRDRRALDPRSRRLLGRFL